VAALEEVTDEGYAFRVDLRLRPEGRMGPVILSLDGYRTYYAEREEGIGVELAESIPIRGNLFVAFLNTPISLHGVRIKEGEAATGDRLAYQVHILPREDPRRSLDENLEKLEPGVPPDLEGRALHAPTVRSQLSTAANIPGS